jgi:hypothetical protein
MLVFEYLIMLDEKRDADGNITAKAEILKDATRVLAKDQTQATTLASREVPADTFEDQEKFDRLIVVVRPF